MTTRLNRGIAVATAAAIAALGLSATAANAATGTKAGNKVTLTGVDGDETFTVSVSDGKLAHDHAGDGGFVSEFDWDSTAADVQEAPADGTITVVVNGAGGADTIVLPATGLLTAQANGGAGADKITGSGANDLLNGGTENDEILGEGGDDRIVGDQQADTVKGGEGNDVLVWNNGDGSDIIDGDNGADTTEVNGAAVDADDFKIAPNGARVKFERLNLVPFTLDLVTERMEISGLGGADKVTAENGAATALTVNGGSGNDNITGADGRDIISGGDGVDTLTGGGQDDRVVGDRGNDVMVGGDGDDTLVWNNGDGTDKADGDAGYDTVEVNGGTGAVGDQFTVKPNGTRAQFDRVAPAPFGIDIAAEVLDLNALGGDDSLVVSDNTPLVIDADGGSGNDTLTGANGNDSLLGASGNDTLTGGPGLDALDGAEGDDRIFARDGVADLLRCGAGNDAVQVDAPGIDAGVACEAADVPAVQTPPPAGVAKKAAASRASTPKGRKVKIKVTCPAGSTTCNGDVQLFTASAIKAGSVKAILALGAPKRFTLKAGQTRDITITLPANYPTLGRKGKLKVRAVVRTDEAGVSTKSLTLKVRS